MSVIMIVVGLLTRWVLIAQLPILVGALLINFVAEMDLNNVIISMIILAVSILYAIYASRKNFDSYYSNWKNNIVYEQKKCPI